LAYFKAMIFGWEEQEEPAETAAAAQRSTEPRRRG